jgi:peptidoglycan L-alanyl-D-glutamate endopeptidase CwlK
MNSHSLQRLKKVHPELARRAEAISARLAARSIVVEITQGLRTFAEQDALYAQGRTVEGKRVTNARGGQSNHNYGLAVDFCVFVNGQPDWNAPYEQWEQIGLEAEAVGLEWGGRWKSFRDLPHVQLPGLSIAQCQKLYGQGGIPLIWERAAAVFKIADFGPQSPVAASEPEKATVIPPGVQAVNGGTVAPQGVGTVSWSVNVPPGFQPQISGNQVSVPLRGNSVPNGAGRLQGDADEHSPPTPTARELSPLLLNTGVRAVMAGVGTVLALLGVVDLAKFQAWVTANIGWMVSVAGSLILAGQFAWSYWEKRNQGKATNTEIVVGQKLSAANAGAIFAPAQVKAFVAGREGK